LAEAVFEVNPGESKLYRRQIGFCGAKVYAEAYKTAKEMGYNDKQNHRGDHMHAPQRKGNDAERTGRDSPCYG
jgi:hypothetical protein